MSAENAGITLEFSGKGIDEIATVIAVSGTDTPNVK
jgi:GDPmannose 4,6-dehydratase